ncbi:DUF6005 family protein [Paenibacillus aceti]|uniref:Butirosin biosynthesis protein H N-terminal domain-containing protein n=1 Tax=Paenibacillus aceti TaxID=1820010 RepID=A0ABQ1VRS3_9BACL|nr:DUF6005 family protein [Paenibacillus aceti]GGF90589.1 hypothetical protein GCM10010913_10080 [Paenibacillus aceti]
MLRQIHCLLDCLAYALHPGTDYRPLFIGAWNTPFEVEEDGRISYFSASITNEVYRTMFEQFYRQQLHAWYDHRLNKQQNFERLRRMIMRIQPNQYLLVQLDLFYLKYETRCYRKIHQPHFVIILEEQDQHWSVVDPYFSWEGRLHEEEISSAFCENPLGEGFLLDTTNLSRPDIHSVSSYLEQELVQGHNSLVQEVKETIRKFTDHAAEFPKKRLVRTFSQIGILAKRKLSYQLLYDYLVASTSPDNDFASKVESLVKGWNAFGYMAIKASMGAAKLEQLWDKAVQLEQQEEEIKACLRSVQRQWKEAQ